MAQSKKSSTDKLQFQSCSLPYDQGASPLDPR
jgi:hypothetical protein